MTQLRDNKTKNMMLAILKNQTTSFSIPEQILIALRERVLLVLFLTGLSYSAVFAQTIYTFSNVDGNMWTTEANWSPSYPGTTISSGDVVRIHVDCIIDASIIIMGDLENSGNLSNNATMEITTTGRLFNVGTVSNNGILNNNGEGFLSNSGVWNNSDVATLNNNATINNFTNGIISNNGTLVNGNNGFCFNNGIISNLINGTFSNDGDIQISTDGELDNLGTLNNNDILGNSGTISNEGSLNNSLIISNLGIINNKQEGTISNDSNFSTFGGGSVTNDGDINNNSTGFIGSDGTLDINITGTIDNEGYIFIGGTFNINGVISMGGTLNNNTDGNIDNTGTLNVNIGSTLNNHGVLNNMTGSELTLEGALSNSGSLKGTGNLTNNNIFLGAAGGIIAPGNSPGTLTVVGNIHIGSNTLESEIDASTSDNDLLAVTGQAVLTDASLEISFLSIPSVLESYTIMTFGSRVGEFTSLNIEPVPGLTTIVSYTDTEVIISFEAVVLPVELVNFQGKAIENVNEITWATSSEFNSEYHFVERSQNAFDDWTAIGKVDAAGSTSERFDYEFLDRSPTDNCYYRLRTFDFDGSFQVSRIINIKRESNTFEVLSVYPVPVKTDIFISIKNIDNKQISLTLTDVSGKTMTASNYYNLPTRTVLNLDVSSFAAGTYYLKVDDGRKQFLKTVVKL